MSEFEGQFAVLSGYGTQVRIVAKVTPKLVKLQGREWPRQIDRSKVYAILPSKDDADKLRQSIDGVIGEYNRRTRAAQIELDTRFSAARDARNKQIANLIAVYHIRTAIEDAP